MRLRTFTTLLIGGISARAQSFLPLPTDTTLVPSERFEGASISYKEVTLCETTAGAKSYSGYVHIPKRLLPDATGWEDTQSAHLFFWYFEARHGSKDAPTSIYLGGGPGESSFDAMSNFPCNFNPDGNSTSINEWSWNNHVNMLYIDQPIGAGFSYVNALNGSTDVLHSLFTPVKTADDLPELNTTTLITTADEGAVVTNTTGSAARTLWQFSQIWFQEFPKWKTSNDEVSLWGVSYGGFWGTASISHFLKQNKLIKAGSHPIANATEINVGTLGIGNGAIDLGAQMKGFPDFAINNTYGIQVYSDDIYAQAMKNITAPDIGCFALLNKCRALAKEKDPEGYGTDDEVNEACVLASNVCFILIQGAYGTYGDRNVFDVTNIPPAEFPFEYNNVFLNQRWVQEALGTAVNFTINSLPVSEAFFVATGDAMITDMSLLEYILENDVNVALVYGDRDYRCNWIGAENVTLSVDFPSASEFRSAGYESVTTNETYTGGLVRQYGNLSFTRLFQAGHGGPAYQPETFYRIFQRAIFRKDIATGKISLSSQNTYASDGPLSVRNVSSEVPDLIKNVCVIYDVVPTCTEEQISALADGSAVVENGIVVMPAGVTGEKVEESGSKESDSDGKSDNGTSSGDRSGKAGKISVSLGTLCALMLATATVGMVV